MALILNIWPVLFKIIYTIENKERINKEDIMTTVYPGLDPGTGKGQ